MSPALFISGIVAVCGFADAPDRPPPLTFDRHEDYIAWWNDRVSRGKTDNAFPLYEKLWKGEEGQGGMPPLEGAAREQYDEIGYRPWDAADFPEFASYLQAAAPHLDTFKKAAKVRDCWQPIPPDTELLYTLASPLLTSGGRASATYLRQAWMRQENQVEKLADAHDTILRYAGHCRQLGHFGGNWACVRGQALVYRSIRYGLDERIITGKDARDAYRAIRLHGSLSFDWPEATNHDWAIQLDLLQYLYPEGTLKDVDWKWNRLRQTTIVSNPVNPVPTRLGKDPKATVALLDRHFVDVKEIVKGVPTAKTLGKLREYYETRIPMLRDDPFAAVMNPDLSRLYADTVKAEAERRGTMLVLAIHAHHAKHGKWPKTLDKIDGKLGLKDLKYYRKDPFSGKSFKYAVRDGKPLLYSVGTDGRDDGGRHDAKWGEGEGGGDFVFWPNQP